VTRLLFVLLATLACLPASASAAPVPDGAVYEEAYIRSSSAVPNDADPELHADVLRPKGATGNVPTVLTVSPYTNHATQNGADKNVSDPGVTRSGPSSRFFDFVEAARLFENGYAYVMVDLRGFGGSQGCNDWGGPGEQNDVKRAVEWVASQPWSNGKVALYGKSYDAWTGLMGLVQKPKGLAAVVAQEPVVDGYRYLYMNRVRFTNSVLTGSLFQVIDGHPGALSDSPQYQSNNAYANAVKPGCYARNIADQNNEDPGTEYWKARNLVDKVKGIETPTFFMQGFIESNTKPDAVFDFWNNLGGTEHRAWFGQWDHVRGNEKVTGQNGQDLGFATGRDTFVPEVMRFLDKHLKGIQPAVADPKITVQSGTGAFRSEEQWPPADSSLLTSPLEAGTYRDDGQNTGDDTFVLEAPNATPGNGVWTISQALPHRAHLAGVPKLRVDVKATPRANLVANVYDIDEAGEATLVSRGAYLLAGSGTVSFDLYGQDWVLEPGHRIGVLISGSNVEWFNAAQPTMQDVTVLGGSIQLPFLRYERTADLSGKAGPTPPGGLQSLDDVKERAFPVPEEALSGSLAEFALPPALTERPQTQTTSTVPVVGSGGNEVVQASETLERRAVERSRTSLRRSLRIKLRARRLRGRRLLITGTAPRGMRLTLKVLRGGKVVAKRQVVARRGKIRVIVKLRRAGSHTVRATGRTGVETGSAAAPRAARVR
jgi:uncharacterized protein